MINKDAMLIRYKKPFHQYSFLSSIYKVNVALYNITRLNLFTTLLYYGLLVKSKYLCKVIL